MAAILIASGPEIFFVIRWLLTGTTGGSEFGWFAYMVCPGFEIFTDIQVALSPVLDLFSFGGALLFILGFAAWYPCVRAGRDRVGRFIALSAVGVVLLYNLHSLALMAFDVVVGESCESGWAPTEQAWWGLYQLLPPLLILLAVRSPKRGADVGS